MNTMLYSEEGLDAFLESYETAQDQSGTANLAEFLPPPDHPLYGQVLRELVRVDMEYAWKRGEPCTTSEYVQRFPLLNRDPLGLAEIVFEEKRLRAQLEERPAMEPVPEWGEGAAPVGLLSRLFEHTSPRMWKAGAQTPYGVTGTVLEEAARSYRAFRGQGDDSIDEWLSSFPGNQAHGDLFRELHCADPYAAERLADAVISMPKVGSEFLGFRLLAELGEGAFARVYLAEQPELANRFVALKVAAEVRAETQRLARLQHTNIVPVYSVHQHGRLQAICMPYYGAMTLADLVRDLVGRESVPVSGKAVVSTLRERKSATQREKARTSGEIRLPDLLPRLTKSPPEPGFGAGQAEEALAELQAIEGLSYVETILRMGIQLADGLAHAHERGILHHDLKPANVLLTDEGRPMLLDFNLAEDTRTHGARASAGGTLPYMAPEHLEAFRGGKQPVDARSDVYSLGIILFELLTGRSPFKVYRGHLDDMLPRYRSDREGPPPELRCWNAEITPAVESIVRHCLEPLPEKRYQSARELQEDLERHLADLPLKHAPETSWRERAGKFHRRHPRLTSSFSISLVAVVALLALGTAFGLQRQNLAKLEALRERQGFVQEMKSVQHLLNAQTGDRDQVKAGLDECRQALNRYGVLNNAAWAESAAVRKLPPDEQTALRKDVGELLFLASRGTELLAVGDDRASLETALALNARAESHHPDGDVPRALWLQRAAILERLGRAEEARTLSENAATGPLKSARDHYLLGAEHAVHGRFREAIPLLNEASRLDPKHYWAWFLLGFCHDGLAQDGRAEACYGTCIALWPEAHWAWFNRGIVYLRQQDHSQAAKDFDRTLDLKPGLADAHINRALARQGLKQYADAERDLSRALELGTPLTRVHFMRARVRDLAGDRAGAEQDRAEGLRREPADEKSWIARGVARIHQDAAAAALADFEHALRLNPRSRAALQNVAHVLAERLNRTQDAVEILERTAGYYPDSAAVVAARGVLRARLGDRRAAHVDAEEALRLDSQPATLYQVAGIYALTAKQEPEDRREAFRLLTSALRKGYGFELLDQDHDLDPLRESEEFRRLVQAARALTTR